MKLLIPFLPKQDLSMPPAFCRFSAIALSTALLLQGSARADDFTWVGGSSTQWNQPLNWANSTDPPTDGDGIPDANDLATFLTSAEVDSGTVQTLAIGPQAGLTLTTNQRIQTANFVNDGSLILAPDGGRDTIDSIGFTWTTLSFAGDVVLSGSGEIVMNDRGDNLLTVANQSVINDTLHTIRGAGIIEVFPSTQEQTASFINRGHLLAEQGELLVISTDLSSNRPHPGGVFTNVGVIEAGDNSVLELSRLNITNFGETRLGTNSQILLSANTLFNSIINPGNVLTFDVTGGGGLNTVSGALQNNGTILLDPVGDPSVNDTTPSNGIRFSGDARLEGVGEVVMRDRFDHQLSVSSQSVANGPAHTIRGSGRIFLDGADPSFTNEGVIRVEEGGVDISGFQARGAFTNTGVIEVADGETLALSSLANVTDFGTIELGSEATVLFSGVLTDSRIRAGTAVTIGTRSGSLPFARLVGTLQNDGQLLFPEGSASLQFLSGAQATFGGAGEIVLSSRQLSSQSSISISSATVTNGPAHTIRGSGVITFSGTNPAFTNEGIVRVESDGVEINGNFRGALINTGLVEVAADSTLDIRNLPSVSLATGEVRLAVSGGGSGTIETRSNLMLDGTVALLLEVERFQDFGFQATAGEFFDLVVAEGGLDITAADFVVLTTAAGSSVLNDIQLSPYDSGVAADTDALLQAPESLFDFELVNDGTTLRATLLETLDITLFPEGDYNRDGVVGVEDYQVWFDSVGESGPGNPADGNGDGVVNTADYAVWRDQLAAALALEDAVAVPEPSTLLIAIGLLPPFALRRK